MLARRARARRELEGCWSVLWGVVDAQMPKLLGQALIRRDGDDGAPLDVMAGRDREFASALANVLSVEFKAALDEYVSLPAAPSGKAAKVALSLVDFEEVEFLTLVERAAARIRNSTEGEYEPLRLRVAGMSGEVDLRDGEFPFRPAMFCRAVSGAMQQCGLQPEQRLKLLPRFDRPLAGVVGACYAELDRHLAERGHGANVQALGGRATLLRRLARGSSTRGGGMDTRALDTNFTDTPWMDGGGDGSAIRSGAQAEEILRVLYQRLQVPAMPAPMLAMPGTAGFMAVPAGMGAVAAQPLPGAAFTNAGAPTVPLLAPQGPGVAVGVPGTAGYAPGVVTVAAAGYVDPGLIGAIHNIQRLSAMAMAAAEEPDKPLDAAVEASELRDKLAERATRQVDKLTIEIVGLLFDRIERDKHVPPRIKELLLRLQFPIIKAALTDPELFVAADRAPRLLIDRIASTAVGWTDEGEQNQRYLAQVQKAVTTVLTSVEEGLGAFEQALAEFEAYLAEEHSGDDDPVARAKRALADAENREIMAINATIKIRSVFDGVQLESYLREFLLQTWVRVLVAAWLKDGGEEPTMRRYLGIVPDLVWSVQPKIEISDRKRLVVAIPTVLGALREGLLLIDWPADKTQEFFGRLMHSHAHAVKALEMAHGLAAPVVEPQAMRAQLDGLKMSAELLPEAADSIRVDGAVVRQVLAAQHLSVDHLDAPQGGAAVNTSVSDEELDRLIASWRRGDWFDLKIGDRRERVQLRWISLRRTLYLFTPAQGERSHSLAPEAMRAHLRSGDLLPVESAPLFERAVQGMMVRLQNAADGVAAGAS